MGVVRLWWAIAFWRTTGGDGLSILLLTGKESNDLCDFARTILENGGDPNERVSTVSHSSSMHESNRFDSLLSSLVPALAVAATRLDQVCCFVWFGFVYFMFSSLLARGLFIFSLIRF